MLVTDFSQSKDLILELIEELDFALLAVGFDDAYGDFTVPMRSVERTSSTRCRLTNEHDLLHQRARRTSYFFDHLDIIEHNDPVLQRRGELRFK